MPTYGKIKFLDFCCHTVNYTKQIYFFLIYFAMNFLDSIKSKQMACNLYLTGLVAAVIIGCILGIFLGMCLLGIVLLCRR